MKKNFWMKAKQKTTPLLFLAPFLIVFTTFVVFPFIFGIVISFFKWDYFQPENTKFVLFDNYTKILFAQESIYFNYFWNGLKNTIIFVIISVPLLIIIPLLLAAMIETKPRGYKLLRFIFFAPSVLSVSTTILIWAWQFNTHGGFINEVIAKLGLGPIKWLTTQPWAWISILIVTIWWTIGPNMIILGAGLKNIDKRIYEAAEIDGANGIQSFFHITLPGIKNQMFIVIILTMIASFNIYGQPDILTRGGPVIDGQFTTTVLMMRIRQIAFGINSQPGTAAAMAVCMGLIIIALSILQNRLQKRQE